MFKTLGIPALLLGVTMVASAQVGGSDAPLDEAPEERSKFEVLRDRAMKIIRGTQELGDWQPHYEMVLDAAERVYERNGWDSEPDLFSLEIVREVGAIPPWQVRERFDRAMQMVGDRYLLDEGQQNFLRREIFRTQFQLFSEHSERIMQYGLEAVQTRAAGEPFTPEQVARWTELAEPVMRDAHAQMLESAERFKEELDPEQRELFEADLQAGNRRYAAIEAMAGKWKAGEWDPHDWGMELDPIQNPEGVLVGKANEAAVDQREAGARNRGAGGGGAAQPEVSAAPVERPPAEASGERPRVGGKRSADPWRDYVARFIARYGLNEEQSQRAWLVYKDASNRRDVFAKRYERQVEARRARARSANADALKVAIAELSKAHQEDEERLFGQLKRRLDRLPTRAQRRAAAEAAPQPAGRDTKPKGE